MSPKSVATKSVATEPTPGTRGPEGGPPGGGKPGAARSPRSKFRAGLAETVAAAAGLLEEGDRAHAGVAADARDLLLDEVVPDPAQPRRHFDEAELRALADDIARRGVLQPVLVRPPAAPGGPYRLVAGERRWRAARMAGRARIPARVRDLADEDVQAAQLAENILRAGLTDIEKGRALRHLYEIRKAQNHKATWEDVGAEVGLGRARIHDLFNLASLPAPVAALIEAGRLSGSHGILLQRAQDAMPEEDLVALAHRAARPEGRRVGGCALTVAAPARPDPGAHGPGGGRGRRAPGPGTRAPARVRAPHPGGRRRGQAHPGGAVRLLAALSQAPPGPPLGAGLRGGRPRRGGSGRRQPRRRPVMTGRPPYVMRRRNYDARHPGRPPRRRGASGPAESVNSN